MTPAQQPQREMCACNCKMNVNSNCTAPCQNRPHPPAPEPERKILITLLKRQTIWKDRDILLFVKEYEDKCSRVVRPLPTQTPLYKQCTYLTDNKTECGENQKTCICFDLLNCRKAANKLVIDDECFSSHLHTPAPEKLKDDDAVIIYRDELSRLQSNAFWDGHQKTDAIILIESRSLLEHDAATRQAATLAERKELKGIHTDLLWLEGYLNQLCIENKIMRPLLLISLQKIKDRSDSIAESLRQQEQ